MHLEYINEHVLRIALIWAPSTYPDMQSEYMDNNLTHTHIYPIVRSICNRFVRLTEEIFGVLVQYNIEDEKMVVNG